MASEWKTDFKLSYLEEISNRINNNLDIMDSSIFYTAPFACVRVCVRENCAVSFWPCSSNVSIIIPCCYRDHHCVLSDRQGPDPRHVRRPFDDFQIEIYILYYVYMCITNRCSRKELPTTTIIIIIRNRTEKKREKEMQTEKENDCLAAVSWWLWLPLQLSEVTSKLGTNNWWTSF